MRRGGAACAREAVPWKSTRDTGARRKRARPPRRRSLQEEGASGASGCGSCAPALRQATSRRTSACIGARAQRQADDSTGRASFRFKGRMRCVKVAVRAHAKVGHRDAATLKRCPRHPGTWATSSWARQDRLLAATAQGMPRDVRKFCLPFLHDIDLKACHPAILASKARLYGVKVPAARLVRGKHTDDLRQLRDGAARRGQGPGQDAVHAAAVPAARTRTASRSGGARATRRSRSRSVQRLEQRAAARCATR